MLVDSEEKKRDRREKKKPETPLMLSDLLLLHELH